MKLYFHHEPGGNFGDDLNRLIWPRLLPGLFDGEVAHRWEEGGPDLGADETLLVGIGTLLNQFVPARPRKLVCGTGTGYGMPPLLDARWRVLWVRGPRTARALGLDERFALADPGLLVAGLDLPRRERRHAFSFMPHHATAATGIWEGICRRLGIHYIDPRGDALAILAEIGRTGTLVTQALHGAIAADALRVPWIPVRSNWRVLGTKWKDWAESVGLEYRPRDIPAIWPARTPFRRVVTFAKTLAGEHALGRIVAECPAVLSADGRVESLVARMTEKLAELRLEADLS